MQNSWIKHTVAFLNSVPSGVQTMVMLIITEIVILSIARILGIDTLEFRKPLFRDEELYNRNMELSTTVHIIDGVVVLAKRNGKYTLLKQFRHAIRIKQCACPRGFSDPNCTPIEDVRREIKEKMGADIIGAPIKFGRIAADCGFTGGYGHVFLTNMGGL